MDIILNDNVTVRSSMSFREKVQKIVSFLIFPTLDMDWFGDKGYKAESPEKAFEKYVAAQRLDKNRWPDGEWEGIEAKREFLKSKSARGSVHEIDKVTFTPQNAQGLAGEGLHLVNFFGQTEYYEYTIRDILWQAQHTGATVHAFNPAGMNQSTGRIQEFNDLVNDGITVVNSLLKQGVHPDKIVFQGNCLGGAIAEAVARHYEETQGIMLRQINSNSFKSIKSTMVGMYPILKIMGDKLKLLLKYVGWEVNPGKHFRGNSPYSCYMYRLGDQSLVEGAKMHDKMLRRREALVCPAEFVEHKNWLESHGLMQRARKYENEEVIDPHELEVFKLENVDAKGNEVSALGFINEFLKRSGEYIAAHPQEYRAGDTAKYLPPAKTKLVESRKLESDIENTIKEFFPIMESVVDSKVYQGIARNAMNEEMKKIRIAAKNLHKETEEGKSVDISR